MKKVNVSTFKAKISSYLRSVRKGNKYLILERNVPVAVVSPNEGTELDISEPIFSFSDTVKNIYKSATFKNKPRSLAFLQADRNTK